MRTWIFFAVAAFSLACLIPVMTIATPSGEAPAVESATTPFSIPDCQPAPDVTFRVLKTGEYLAELIASGLQPGESPYVYYATVDDLKKSGGAGFPGDIVNEDGEFYSDLNWRLLDVDMLEPPEGQASAIWEFRLVHSRGVECARITLP